ncbi:hypothetical protein TNCV_1564771 [Trichonephila clavipes]|nr:hypothetical protein TNCV_1564771 [Trichonephila clavipes]
MSSGRSLPQINLGVPGGIKGDSHKQHFPLVSKVVLIAELYDLLRFINVNEQNRNKGNGHLRSLLKEVETVIKQEKNLLKYCILIMIAKVNLRKAMNTKRLS